MRPIAVIGPTATGKSALALDLAERLGGEIVNADAMQLYRGMDIGTAKVPTAERRGIPHHLLDVLEVTETATVATYQQRATAAVDDILARGHVPVIVGGSMMYIQALLDDWAFPATDPQVRARWEERLAQIGVAALHAELAARDPAAAAVILSTDGRRTVRALEVIELTGQPFAASAPTIGAPRWDTVIVGLDWQTEKLDERIARRTDLMFEQGFVAEVRQLLGVGLRDGVTAARAIGYAQVIDALDAGGGPDELAGARELTFIGTRRYVRRQRSWFGRDHRVVWLAGDAARPEGVGGRNRVALAPILEYVKFTKGHGTQNDFVVLPDVHIKRDLSVPAVQALCDRQRGLGADGVLRVTTVGAALEGGVIAEKPGGVSSEDWFMDYRNADGSIAEMCGNGVRVFAHYLRSGGLEHRDEFVVASLAGPRPVRINAWTQLAADITVDMGPVKEFGAGEATVGGRRFSGLAIDVGNPHLACVDAELTDEELRILDVGAPVSFDESLFPEGVNVEVLTAPVNDAVRMRVHERGVGETRSCGTGTVAAAYAGLRSLDRGTGELAVNIPGGQVRVTITDESSFLRGPSMLLADGEISDEWWNGIGACG